MRVAEFATELAAFTARVDDYNTAWLDSLGDWEMGETFPARNRVELRGRSQQLSREFGRLSPFITRFDENWRMRMGVDGVVWNAMDLALSFRAIAMMKSTSAERVVEKLNCILGQLNNYDPELEIPADPKHPLSSNVVRASSIYGPNGEIRILFFAAEPDGEDRLALGKEVRDIQERIRMSDQRDSLKFESRFATRPSDVFQAMNEVSPTIVHFSGHGNADEIAFETSDGQTKSVSKEALVQVMAAEWGGLSLVVFNTCDSVGHAEAVVQRIPAAIGMTTAISDDAARVFSAQLYSAIGFGKSLKVAFQQACAAISMEGIQESDVPQLFVMDGVDSSTFVLGAG